MLMAAPNIQICASHVLTGIETTSAPNGGSACVIHSLSVPLADGYQPTGTPLLSCGGGAASAECDYGVMGRCHAQHRPTGAAGQRALAPTAAAERTLPHRPAQAQSRPDDCGVSAWRSLGASDVSPGRPDWAGM
jgi:hypothetical protein